MKFRLDPLSPSGIAQENSTVITGGGSSSTVTTGGVSSLSKSGSAQLTGDVTLSEGSNITLTQTGNNISIASTGGTGAVDSVNGQTGTVVLDPDDLDDTATAHKFVTAADKTVLSNTSGTNSGDQDLSGLVPKTTTVNGHALSTNVTVTANDVLPSQTGNSGKFLTTNGTNSSWATSGDMTAAVYDPTNKTADAFNQDNMADGTTNKNYTATEKTKLSGIATGADVTATQLPVSIHAATGKTTPADADEIPLTDSASSFALKKLTWANVKATAKTYFDTLYANIVHIHTESDVTNLVTDLAAKAPLASPDFTGSPTAPTQSSRDNSIKLATTAYADALMPAGSTISYAGFTAPTGWLLCYGQAISRSTYAALFSAITNALGAFTVTIATPAVVTKTGHGMRTGDQVYLTTTGALPTGLSTNTIYYAHVIDADTFHLSTTQSNSYGGTYIATSGSQSGTHSATYCPWGLGDGSTTFNVPDYRGRVLAGKDDMGGTAASRLTLDISTGVRGFNLNNSGGEQSNNRTLSDNGQAQIAQGSSGVIVSRRISTASYTETHHYTATGTTNSNGAQTLGSALAGTTDTGNNTQPTIITNYIIKT